MKPAKHKSAATICAFLCVLLFAGCASNPAKKLSNTTFTRMEFVQGRTQLYTTSDENTMRSISELLARQNWRSYLPTTEPANWQDRAFIHLFAGNNEVGTVSFYVNTPRSHLVLTFSINSYHTTLSEADTALLKQCFIRFPNWNLH